MRILHTGDWHMNARLGREDRSRDIVASLEQIAVYLDSDNVDVMVVAGDLFCDRSDREGLRSAVGEIRRIFGPFLTRPGRPGTIVAISGNHDSDIFFETLRNALDLAPVPAGPHDTLSPGRMYLFHRPNLVRLAGGDGTIVQFLLMPYPKESWLQGLEYDTAAGQNRMKQNRFVRYLRRELIEKKLDPTLPAVLVSHILVEGTAARQGYRLGLEHDVVFSESDIPTELAYIAYGHIHQAQAALTNAPWIRYCGSVERLDAGERDDDKSVVLVKIGPTGRQGDPVIRPLDTTPLERFEFGEADDPEAAVSGLEERWRAHGDRERVLTSVKLFYTPGAHAPDALRQRLHDLFPRLYECDLRPCGIKSEAGGSDQQIDLSDVVKNTVDYVSARVAMHPLRDNLLAALYDLLTPGVSALQRPAVQGPAVQGPAIESVGSPPSQVVLTTAGQPLVTNGTENAAAQNQKATV